MQGDRLHSASHHGNVSMCPASRRQTADPAARSASPWRGSATAGPCSSFAISWYAACTRSRSSRNRAKASPRTSWRTGCGHWKRTASSPSNGTNRTGGGCNYRLTEKGIDLAPVLLELLIWGARHEETGAPCALIARMAANREQVLAETRRRWQELDRTPLLPPFANPRNITKRRKELSG